MRRWIAWKRRGRLGPYLANLLVLIVLAAIGWFGHHYHWTIPGFDEAPASADVSQRHDAAPASGATHSANTPATTHAHARAATAELPALQFDSIGAVRNCGIETGTVDQRAMEGFVTANGVVGYDQTCVADLAVRVPGIVWRVEKRLGDIVDRGDILVIVDSAEVGQTKADLLEAIVNRRLKALNVERLEKVRDVVAQRDLVAARAANEVAQTQMFNAFQELVSLGFPLKLEDIVKLPIEELTQSLRVIGLPESIASETQSANMIPLVAPFHGLVTNCELVRGERVEPSQPQYVIADIDRMWINLDVRQEDASKLRIGTTVEFIGEGDRPPVTCKLTWIGTEVNPRTRTIRARAEGINPTIDESQADHESRRLLQVGTFGTAHIHIDANPVAIAVPNEALHWQWEIGREVVFLPSQDGLSFTPRVVTKGLTRGDYTQIVDGLKSGERIVTDGSRVLSSELSELLQRSGRKANRARDFNRAIDASRSAGPSVDVQTRAID